MAEYIDRDEAKEWIAAWLKEDKYWHPYSKGKNIPTAEVFDTLSRIPAADVVSKAAYDQVAWERHLAEVQLKSIGKSLGEKMDDVQPVQWIPVTERLPNGNGKYLVSGKDKVWVCEFMIFGSVGGWCNSAMNPCVKYWMPLPKPPEDGEENG